MTTSHDAAKAAAGHTPEQRSEWLESERKRLKTCVQGLQSTLITCEQACWKEGQTFEGLNRDIRRAAQKFLDGKHPAKELQDKCERLEASNKQLRAACEHVIKWLGHPEFEDSDGANDAFKKALEKCRAALTHDTEDGE